MLRTIRRGLDLPGAKDDPWFNACICRFLTHLSGLKKEADNLTHEVLFDESVTAFGEKTLPNAAKYNEEFLKRNSKSFMHVLSGECFKIPHASL